MDSSDKQHFAVRIPINRSEFQTRICRHASQGHSQRFEFEYRKVQRTQRSWKITGFPLVPICHGPTAPSVPTAGGSQAGKVAGNMVISVQTNTQQSRNTAEKCFNLFQRRMRALADEECSMSRIISQSWSRSRRLAPSSACCAVCSRSLQSADASATTAPLRIAQSDCFYKAKCAWQVVI